MNNYALITAAGEGKRLPGAVAKQFRLLEHKPILAWTVDKFERSPCIDAIYLIVPEADLPFVKEAIVERYELKKVQKIIPGGETRFDSILLGLRALPASSNLVFIHDGVRPFVTPEEIARVGKIAEEHDAAILALPQTESVKRVEGDFIVATLNREKIYLAQTPQVFKYELIISAYLTAMAQEREYADDAAVCEAAGYSVRVVEGGRSNLKITTPEDFELARRILRG